MIFEAAVPAIFESRRMGAVWRKIGAATLPRGRFVAGVGGLSCPAVLAAGSKGFGRPPRLRPFDADQAFRLRGELGRTGWSVRRQAYRWEHLASESYPGLRGLIVGPAFGPIRRPMFPGKGTRDPLCPVFLRNARWTRLLSRRVMAPRRKRSDEGLSEPIEGFPWILWIRRPRRGCFLVSPGPDAARGFEKKNTASLLRARVGNGSRGVGVCSLPGHGAAGLRPPAPGASILTSEIRRIQLNFVVHCESYPTYGVLLHGDRRGIKTE